MRGGAGNHRIALSGTEVTPDSTHDPTGQFIDWIGSCHVAENTRLNGETDQESYANALPAGGVMHPAQSRCVAPLAAPGFHREDALPSTASEHPSLQTITMPILNAEHRVWSSPATSSRVAVASTVVTVEILEMERELTAHAMEYVAPPEWCMNGTSLTSLPLPYARWN